MSNNNNTPEVIEMVQIMTVIHDECYAGQADVHAHPTEEEEVRQYHRFDLLKCLAVLVSEGYTQLNKKTLKWVTEGLRSGEIKGRAAVYALKSEAIK